MKLKNLTKPALFLTSFFLISCSASGTVNVNPSATPTPSASAEAAQMVFSATLSGASETPPVSTSATGTATLTVNADKKGGTLNLTYQGLSGAITGSHIHGPADPGVSANVLISLDITKLSSQTITLTDEQFGFLNAGKLYVNIHTASNPNGEIRGQLTKTSG
jgi:hypothetical protein